MYGMIGAIGAAAINAGSNIYANYQNQKNYEQNRTDVLNNNATSAMMLGNVNDGKDILSGFYDNPELMKYASETDMLNPYLALTSSQLQKKSMDLNEQQFKYSKYVTENAAQIKANDYKKAGFSPLLAVGGSASYSPVSTGSSGASSSRSQTAMQNPNTHTGMNIVLNTALAKEKAEIDVLKSQKNKIDAETSTELNRPANISADTKLKENQSIKTNEETKLIKEQITTELYKQGLTKNQIEYYAVQIQSLEYDLNESIKNGIRTTDQMPFVFSEIQNIVESMGIDPNSNLGKYLVAGSYALLMYQGARVKAPKNNTTNNHNVTNHNSSYTTNNNPTFNSKKYNYGK